MTLYRLKKKELNVCNESVICFKITSGKKIVLIIVINKKICKKKIIMSMIVKTTMLA